MEIAITIIPIFTVICIGWLARLKGFLPDEFISPANRLIFYLAIPAMIFRSVSNASLKTQFNPNVLAGTLVSVVLASAISLAIGRRVRISARARGTFIQSAIHGNLGYIGLAVSFYYLGEQGLAGAGIVAGVLMILQNFISVLALQLYSPSTYGSGKKRALAGKILGNPVIVSACCGIVASLLDLQIPLVMDRTLRILGGMALPTALIIIGGSLSIQMVRATLTPVIIVCILKLAMLPAIGFSLFIWLGIPQEEYLPSLILLASPSATVSVVMAREMDGDEDFAVAAISAGTLLSIATFSLWLGITSLA